MQYTANIVAKNLHSIYSLIIELFLENVLNTCCSDFGSCKNEFNEQNVLLFYICLCSVICIFMYDRQQNELIIVPPFKKRTKLFARVPG